MSTAAPTKPDTTTDQDFKDLISQQFDHELDDSDNGEDFSHYVKKEHIVDSAIGGTVIEALCGKRWKPKKSPQGLKVCPKCKEIYEQLDEGE